MKRHELLDKVIATYIRAVQEGKKPNQKKLLSTFPEIADDLAAFFAKQAQDPGDAVTVSRHDAVADSPTVSNRDQAKPATPSMARTPTHFGDYEILGEIARGGMGVVFKARQISLERPVALKMILAGQLADAVEVGRFRREAEAAANLDHPYIVPIYEIGDVDGQHFFSMKLIAGESLARRLGRYHDDPREAAQLLAKAARAVHHAHQRGILHRDLKPGNILVDDQGQPHVTDFGLACKTHGGDGLTQTGAAVGTPAYMAPEQALGQRGLTTAVDVHALGGVLYALLTKRPPFSGNTGLELMKQVVSVDPVPPGKWNPRVPRDLEVICLKCLSKEPAKRYASAESLAEDLERWLQGEPITARPTGPWERARLWARRRPALAGLMGVTAVAVLVIAVISGVVWNQNHELEFANATLTRTSQEKDLALEEKGKALADKEQALDEKGKALVDKGEALGKLERQVAQFKTSLMTTQIRGALMLAATDPLRGAELLEDESKCPLGLRDFTWGYAYGQCRPDRLTLPTLKPLWIGLMDDDSKAVVWEGERFRQSSNIHTSSNEGGLSIWDLKTGKECTPLGLRSLRDIDVDDLLYVRHAQVLITIRQRKLEPGKDNVQVWDLKKGVKQHSFRLLEGSQLHVASDDGRFLACALPGKASGNATYFWGEVRVWELVAGKESKTIEWIKEGVSSTHSIVGLALSPEGQHLAAIVYRNKPRLEIRDVNSGTVVAETDFPTWPERVDVTNPRRFHVAYAPDGKTLVVTASSDKKRTRFQVDAQTGVIQKQWDPQGPNGIYDRTGRMVAENEFLPASLEVENRLARIPGLQHPYCYFPGGESVLAVSSGEREAAGWGRKGTVKLNRLSLEPYQSVHANIKDKSRGFSKPEDPLLSVDPGGQWVARGSEADGGDIVNLESGKTHLSLPGLWKAAHFMPGGNEVALCRDRKSIELWHVGEKSPRQVAANTNQKGSWFHTVPSDCLLSHDNRWLALGGGTHHSVYDMQSGVAVAESGGFDPRESTFIKQGSLSLMDVATKKTRWALEKANHEFLQNSPDGRWMLGLKQTWEPAKRNFSQTVIIHETAAGLVKGEMDLPRQQFAFAPNGKLFAGLKGREIKIWDFEQGKDAILGTLDADGIRVEFSPEGTLFSLTENEWRSWDVSTGKVLKKGTDSEGIFLGMAISGSGRWLATHSMFGLRIWDVHTGQTTAAIPGYVNLQSNMTMEGGRQRVDNKQAPPRFTGDVLWLETGEAWTAPEGKPCATLADGPHASFQASLTDDGKRLVRIVGNKVQIFDLTDGTELPGLTLDDSHRVDVHERQYLAGHPRAGRGVTLTADRKTVIERLLDPKDPRRLTWRFWDLDTRALRCEIANVPIDSAATSDGALLLSPALYGPGGDAHVLSEFNKETDLAIWETRQGKRLADLKFPKAGNSIAWPDKLARSFEGGKKLAVMCSVDATYIIWDTANAKRTTIEKTQGKLIAHGDLLVGTVESAKKPGPKEARVFEAATGKMLATVTGSGGGACFSPDRRYLLLPDPISGGSVIELATGQKRTLPGMYRFVVNRTMQLEEEVFFVPATTKVLVSDGWQSSDVSKRKAIFLLWDVATGKISPLATFDAQSGEAPRPAIASADGRYLVFADGTGALSRPVAVAIEIATGKQVFSMRDQRAVRFMDNGRKLLLSGTTSPAFRPRQGMYESLMLVEFPSGQPLWKWEGYAKVVMDDFGMSRALWAVDKSGSRLILPTEDELIILDGATGKELRRLETPRRAVPVGVISADGQWLAGRTGDRLRIWNARTGVEDKRVVGPIQNVYFPRNQPNAFVVFRNATELSLVDVADGKTRQQLMNGEGVAESMASSHDGSLLAAVTTPDSPNRGNKLLVVWQAKDGTERYRFTWDEPHLRDSILEHFRGRIFFDPSGRWLVRCGRDETRLFDLREQSVRRLPFVRADHGAFSADGAFLALVGCHKEHGLQVQTPFDRARVWDLASGAELSDPHAPGVLTKWKLIDVPGSVAFLEREATGPSEAASAYAGLPYVLATAISPDRRTLAVAMKPLNLPLTIKLYDLATGQEQLTLPTPSLARDVDLTFSPDGGRLVACDRLMAVCWPTRTAPLDDKHSETAPKGYWEMEGDDLVARPTRAPLHTVAGITFDRAQVFLLGSPRWRDYDFDADVQVSETPGKIGLVVRVGGFYNENYLYAIFVTGNASPPALEGVGGLQAKLADWARAPRLEAGSWHRLRVSVRGHTITLFVDGREMATGQAMVKLVRQGALPAATDRGGVGLAVWNTLTRFRNLKVTDVEGVPLLGRIPPSSNRWTYAKEHYLESQASALARQGNWKAAKEQWQALLHEEIRWRVAPTLALRLLAEDEPEEAIKALDSAAASSSFKEFRAAIAQAARGQMRLRDFHDGTFKPGTASERIELAQAAHLHEEYALAMAQWEHVSKESPKIFMDTTKPHRYLAACSAVCAGTGQGRDAKSTSEVDRARWRGLALDWLRTLLTGPPAGTVASRRFQELGEWQEDPSLASVRSGAGTLPVLERAEWARFWQDVAARKQEALGDMGTRYWRLAGQELVADPNPGKDNRGVLYFGDERWTDFTLEFDISASSLQLVLRMTEPKNFWRADLYFHPRKDEDKDSKESMSKNRFDLSQGYSFDRTIVVRTQIESDRRIEREGIARPGETRALVLSDAIWPLGGWHKVRAVCRGPEMSVYVDGQLMGFIRDESVRHGPCGLLVSAGGRLRNLRVVDSHGVVLLDGFPPLSKK